MRNVGEAEDRSRGFTLVEVMVVVVILGVLMAIAIPTFISTASTARDRVTETNLTLAMQTEIEALTTTGTWQIGHCVYDNSTTQPAPAILATMEPNLAWASVWCSSFVPNNYTGTQRITNRVYINRWFVPDLPGSDVMQVGSQSPTGRCLFMERDVSTAAGAASTGYSVQTGPTCWPFPMPGSPAPGSASSHAVNGSWGTWYRSW